jgi:hypothetical protein
MLTVCQAVWLEALVISGVVDTHRDIEAIDEGDVVPVETSGIDSEFSKGSGRNTSADASQTTVAAACRALKRRCIDTEIALCTSPESVSLNQLSCSSKITK